jgi:hypothetical protein
MKQFSTSFLLKNKHIQTLYSSFFRKTINLKIEIETFILSDGDFIDCYWYNKPLLTDTIPIIILFHGLEGSFKSPYIQGLMKEANKEGFSSVVMHFRGCSYRENNLAKAYHSGATDDAHEWIKHISIKHPHSKLFCAGYSMGGNMLLKLLSEQNNHQYITASTATSVPFLLNVSSKTMEKGFSKIYQHHLLKSLKKNLNKKFIKHDMSLYITLKQKEISNINTFWDLDDKYTAPIHGFKSAQDYYDKCSSRQFLKNIETPTLLIQAKDDPFMTPEVIPTKDELSEYVTLELSENGGHVGFIGGSFFKPEYWLEKRIVEYFKTFL